MIWEGVAAIKLPLGKLGSYSDSEIGHSVSLLGRLPNLKETITGTWESTQVLVQKDWTVVALTNQLRRLACLCTVWNLYAGMEHSECRHHCHLAECQQQAQAALP